MVWYGMVSYRQRVNTEKLPNGFIESTTDISSCGCLVVRLQDVNDNSADEYVDDRRCHQDDCQQRVHVDLYRLDYCNSLAVFA